MSDHEGEPGAMPPRDEMEREMTSLMEANRLTSVRLRDQGIAVEPARTLLMRINTVIESAFGPIDYKALGDPERTTDERLLFEVRYQQRLRQTMLDVERQAKGAVGGLIVPPKAGDGLILPNN